MSLLPSADVFKSIELQAVQLFRRQLICPHEPGARCSAGEHLTLSEAKEAAARHAADIALRDALWRSVRRCAHSDLPDMAHRGQLLVLAFVIPYLRKSAANASRALYVDVADVRSAMVFAALHALAAVDDGDDVRDRVMRAANAAAWAVERANPAERTTDPHALVDRVGQYDDGYEPVRSEWGIEALGEVDSETWQRISGEALGATLHGLGLLEDFFASASEQGQEPEPDEPQEETE